MVSAEDFLGSGRPSFADVLPRDGINAWPSLPLPSGQVADVYRKQTRDDPGGGRALRMSFQDKCLAEVL